MARQVVAEFDAVTGPFLNKLTRIDNSITRFERGTMRSFGRVEKGMDSLVSSARHFHTITSLIATGFGVNIASQWLDEVKLIRNALREAGDASQETFDKVFRSSVRALANFKDVAQGVQRFQKAVGDRQDIDASIRQLETLNKLLALSGKTTQERSSTMIQFSQALQAGYLQGEELRAIRENAPIELTRRIAEMAGGTIQDLKDLAAQGQLTTTVMIDALASLEEEADRRFGNIQVTIDDASKIFRSGAISALEGFDEGLGISRTTVAGLKVLGETLGQSAEAAEKFGMAVKVAGAVLLSSFAARRIQNVTDAISANSAARRQNAVAADAQLVAASKEVEAQRRSVAAAQSYQLQVATTANSMKKQEAATKRVNAAQQRLNRANREYASALNVANTAQSRLLFTTRAVTGAATLMRGAFAFLGGWPGLILTAATAFFVLRGRVESTAEAIERLEVGNSNVEASMWELVDVSERLVEAAERRAKVSDESSQRIYAATKREYEAKRQLLALDLKREQARQRERQAQIDQLTRFLGQKEFKRPSNRGESYRTAEDQITELNAQKTLADIQMQEMAEILGRDFADVVGNVLLSDLRNLSQETEALGRAMRDVEFAEKDAIIAGVKDLNDRIQEAIDNVGDLDDEKLENLKDSFDSLQQMAIGLVGSVQTLRSEMNKPFGEGLDRMLYGQGQAAYRRRLHGANQAASSGLLDLIAYAEGTAIGSNPSAQGYNTTLDYGRWTGGSRVLTGMTLQEILQLQEQMLSHPENRAAYGNGQGSSALGRYQITRRTLLDLIGTLDLDMNQLFNADLQDRLGQQLIRRRNGQGIGGLRNEWEGLRYVGEDTIRTAMGNNSMPDVDPTVAAELRAEQAAIEKARREEEDRTRDLLSAVEDDKRDALDIIETLFSTEERHANQIKEMIALRDRLIQQYGEEHELVKGVDAAISETERRFYEAQEAQETFWQTMSNRISQSIEQWRGWGDFIRGTLASIVQQYGANFLATLLTGGFKDGLTPTASWVQVAHIGGIAGSATARRQVHPGLFAGAPRYHGGGIAGLRPGEVPAVLERGERIIPKKGFGQMRSSGMTIINNNDFSNADPSMKPWLEAQLAKQEQQFEPRFAQTMRKFRRSRFEP